MTIPTLTPQQLIRRKKTGQPLSPEDEKQVQRHIISVLVENTIGAFNRIVNMFSARGFNLESVAVGETDDPSISRMTIVTTGDDRIIAQVNRQLDRLVDVLQVDDLTTVEYVEREICLLKVRYSIDNRPEIMDTLNIFRGTVVDVTKETMTFQITGPTKKINAFIGMMRDHGIVEIARSGRVAMRRALAFGS